MTLKWLNGEQKRDISQK